MSGPYTKDRSYGNLLLGKSKLPLSQLGSKIVHTDICAELNKFSSRSFGINAYRKEERYGKRTHSE